MPPSFMQLDAPRAPGASPTGMHLRASLCMHRRASSAAGAESGACFQNRGRSCGHSTCHGEPANKGHAVHCLIEHSVYSSTGPRSAVLRLMGAVPYTLTCHSTSQCRLPPPTAVTRKPTTQHLQLFQVNVAYGIPMETADDLRDAVGQMISSRRDAPSMVGGCWALSATKYD